MGTLGFVANAVATKTTTMRAKTIADTVVMGWNDQLEITHGQISPFVIAQNILSIHPENHRYGFVEKIEEMNNMGKDITPRDIVWIVLNEESEFIHDINDKSRKKVDNAIIKKLRDAGLG